MATMSRSLAPARTTVPSAARSSSDAVSLSRAEPRNSCRPMSITTAVANGTRILIVVVALSSA